MKLNHKELIRNETDSNNSYLLLNKIRSKDNIENSNIDMNISSEPKDTIEDTENT